MYVMTPARKQNFKNKTYTTEVFIEKAKLKHGGKYNYSGVIYDKSQIPVIIICREHGEFSQRPADHLRGYGCPNCSANNKPLSNADVIKRIKEAYDCKNLSFSKLDHQKSDIPVVLTCKKHGDFNIFVGDIGRFNKKYACPECNKKKKAQSRTKNKGIEFVDQLKLLLGEDNYSFEKTKYTKAHDKVTITCKKHGDFIQKAYIASHGTGCPSCGKRCSKPQRKLIEHFLKLNSDVKTNHRLSSGKELDLFFPTEKLAIEIDGIYWHTEQFRNEEKTHYTKTKECKKLGIQLLRFWDYEVEEKFDLVCSMIEARLKINETIYARKTTIKEVCSKDASGFLEQNHLQGSCSAKVSIGLYESDELVALMTFGKPRFNKEYEWELIRFCSLNRVTVVGGASKLLKYFEKNYRPKSLLSYANLRFSYGNLYKQLGFDFTNKSRPNFSYVKGGKITSRYSTQKHKLSGILENFDPVLSAHENMNNHGYFKLWDCGNLVFGKLY